MRPVAIIVSTRSSSSSFVMLFYSPTATLLARGLGLKFPTLSTWGLYERTRRRGDVPGELLRKRETVADRHLRERILILLRDVPDGDVLLDFELVHIFIN